MEDKILGILEDSKCPKCHSTKVVCDMQYPLEVTLDMRGRIIRKHLNTGRRISPSNEWMARQYKSTVGGEYQCAIYRCEKCGWQSETYVP